MWHLICGGLILPSGARMDRPFLLPMLSSITWAAAGSDGLVTLRTDNGAQVLTALRVSWRWCAENSSDQFPELPNDRFAHCSRTPNRGTSLCRKPCE